MTIRRNSVFFLFVLVFISVLGCGRNGKFQLSPTDAVQAMLFSEEVVVPAEIMETVQAAGEAAVLVDVRPPSEFMKGHLLNAINVPAQHVLEPEYRKLWKKEGVTYYFYGADQVMERSFAKEEAELSAFFGDLNPDRFVALDDEAVYKLRLFVAYQLARTRGAAEHYSKVAGAFAKQVIGF